MALKLGEALVKESLITREQLKLALERQVIFGGRIGTNIVELRIITEKELSGFLSWFFKVPAAEPALLASIDSETISCIGRELAEKYKTIPFKKDRNRLSVAMLDPLSMKGVDELRFITGYDIVPHVITELRLLYILEKYYGIERDLRYISIFGKEEEKETTQEDAKVQGKKVKEEFANARDKDEVIGILLSASKKIASRAAIFVLKGEKLEGWKSRGLNVQNTEMAVGLHSIFTEVITGRNYYRGPVLRIPENEPLLAILSGVPQDCLVIPIQMRDKIIALMYADNGNSSVLDANLTYLNTLIKLATLSLEIVILRNKIMEL